LSKRPQAQLAAVLHTVPETAARLNCSEMHVYRLAAAGELAVVDIAPPTSTRSKTRIRSDDLADYIERQTRIVRHPPAAGTGQRRRPAQRYQPDALAGSDADASPLAA
jgi:excisionase family DNA binding protein